jgi:hypothetical protein
MSIENKIIIKRNQNWEINITKTAKLLGENPFQA